MPRSCGEEDGTLCSTGLLCRARRLSACPVRFGLACAGRASRRLSPALVPGPSGAAGAALFSSMAGFGSGAASRQAASGVFRRP